MQLNNYKLILDKVNIYYTGKVRLYGPTPKGVDWKSLKTQETSFDQLLKIIKPDTTFSINDYGCGYAHLYKYMKTREMKFKYTGLDVSEEMIKAAQLLYSDEADFSVTCSNAPEKPADYSVASGIFNVKLDIADDMWLDYVLAIIGNMDAMSSKGFSFNCLTAYSDKDFMRPDLYYADPCFLFDYCKRKYAQNVALLHDYGSYVFTILVRKE